MLYRFTWSSISGAALLLAAAPVLTAAPDAALAMKVLKAQCLSCHNEEKHKGGLLMTSREALLKGGDNGPALVEEKPEESAIITALAASAETHMPPKKQLSAAQIAVLTEWVRAGAAWDAAALVGQSPPRAVTLAELPAAMRTVTALAVSPDCTRLAAGCRRRGRWKQSGHRRIPMPCSRWRGCRTESGWCREHFAARWFGRRIP
jgi:mono/diheme cytochrome c family protein